MSAARSNSNQRIQSADSMVQQDTQILEIAQQSIDAVNEFVRAKDNQ